MSLLLMAVDHRTTLVAPVRSALSTATAPLFWLADGPYSVFEGISGLIFLHDDNAHLRDEVLSMSVRAQRISALEEENARLRALLGSSRRVEGRVLFAEVIGLSPDPLREMLVVDKGDAAGVRPGLAVLDSDGLVGQVIETGAFDARILLITDLSHSTPVQVLRNGYRAILRGTGDPQALQLQHVPNTADVQEGDRLITSGLGGRFPPGYPVGEVVSVVHESGAPFATVVARPAAQLARSRHLVVVTDPDSPPHLDAAEQSP
ncbi:MAG TPA: rod shape-determining protein MreC [Pseudomonadales bacterium]|nr:rod shape-determining protein MreC [Pseudomonadales bacterium]